MNPVALFSALVVLLASGLAHGAKAPMSKDAMAKQANHVVRATVLDVTSKVQKSEIQTGLGIFRDTVYTITIRIQDVSKGKALKVGQEIRVLAWKPHTRKPNPPGLQGHEVIPKKGDTATFYLKGGGKKPYEPLLPNGMVVVKE